MIPLSDRICFRSLEREYGSKVCQGGICSRFEQYRIELLETNELLVLWEQDPRGQERKIRDRLRGRL
jgi:hypothetical protein